MDWKSISKVYAAKLKSALDVQRHALQLASLSQARQAGITTEQIDKLKKAGDVAEKQMNRLENGEFRIAVVGLEKAGKSTFINAWLGYDLLPAKTERCTFTTTQIYSVQHATEQRFETEPKSAAAFRQYEDELTAQSQSADRSAAQKAKNDLEVIGRHRNTLQEILSEGKRDQRFTQLADIKDTLTKYVADERYAHAMQEARLYTRELAAVDGVVFYDVPGLDSGLSKHIEESKAMLADCDAIILVQRRDISLKAYEQDLIRFGESGDPYLKLADKLFIFWGQTDLQPSRDILEEDWLKLLNIWQAESIPENRIVRGSAGAHLVLHGFDIPKVGSLGSVQEKMSLLTGITDHQELKQTTGISELQQRIQHYLDAERTTLLEKRCKGMLGDILDTAQQIYQTISQFYPEDPEQAKRSQEQNNTIEFSEWWEKRWPKIHANTNNLFKEHSQNDQVFNQFKENYENSVQQSIENLPSRQLDARNIIFDKCSTPVFDPTRSNIEWRDHLHEESRKLLRGISTNMANGLIEEAYALIEDIKKELWNTEVVENQLIKNKQRYQENLERGFNTLFMRFARPIVEILIRSPVGSTPRAELFKKLDADIEIIDNYITTDEPAFKRVSRYAKYGSGLLTNAKLRSEVLGSSATVVKFSLRQNFLANAALELIEDAAKHVTKTNDSDQLVIEVESDIQALEHFLLQGIFDAAGFKAFREQELSDLRDSFLEKVGTWSGVVQNEWKNGNPALLKELPPNLQNLKFDTVVSDKLRQLGIALKQSSIKN
jgi:hypothetical protein